MASANFTVRRAGSCSIQSEQDLVIKDEANFSAAQTLKQYEHELLDLHPETVRVYLYEKNLLKVNENETLKDGTKNKREKMNYILTETNCIKGTRGLQHILEMLRALGNPLYTELANKIDTDYNKRMETIRREFPYESQPINVERLRTRSKIESQQQPVTPAALPLQEKIVTTELKIIVLGDDGVGKTSLLIRYCTGKFSTDKKPAITNDCISNNKPLVRNSHHYELKFWDTHGMEKHNNMIPSVYYRDAVGALLVYDVTNSQSLKSLEQWWKNACAIVMKKNGQPIPAVLLANKCDLGDIDETEMCDELRCCQRFSTSAKKGEGISEAIERLMDDIIKEGLTEEESECWTEIPANSVRIVPFNPVENIQKTYTC